MIFKNIPFIALLFWSLQAATVRAQFGAAHPIFPANPLNSGQRNYPIDIENDGDKDLVFYHDDNTLSLLRNDGTGHFAQGEFLAENAIGPSFFVDFNHDDLPDLLVRLGNILSWRANLGDGSFGGPFPIGQIGVFKIVDMNHDGELDIFDGASWMENEGAGIFVETHGFWTLGQNEFIVDFVDINSDGLLDNVYQISFNNDVMYWRAQMPDGTLSPTSNIIGAGAPFAQFFDLDYDGDLDVIDWEIHSGPAFIQMHRNDGTGSFGPPTPLYESNSLYSINDVDGDGFADILLPANPNVFAWGKNDGNGNFTFQLTNVLASYDWQFADISGDGHGDLILNHGAAFGDGAGGFGPIVTYFPEFWSIQDITVADAEGDGDADLLFYDNSKQEIGWVANNGAGGFDQKNILRTGASLGIVAADFDADGYPDIATKDLDSLQFIWKGSPNGYSASPDTIARNLENSFIYEMVDIDGDGDLDWHTGALFQPQPGTNAWMYNDGAGNFSDTMPPYYLGGIGFWDIDSDSAPDLLSSSFSPMEFFWQKNLGAGNFGPPISIGLYYPNSIKGHDMDQDGDMDLLFDEDDIIINGELFHFIWLENQNNGSAWVEHPISKNYTTDYCLGDFNQDGSVDVFMGSWHNNSNDTTNIAWFPNDGMGNFGDSIFIGQQLGQKSFVVADVDLDSDLDVFYLGSLSGWYENFSANPVLNGSCFFDANENGVQDGSEGNLPNVKIRLEPGGQTTYSQADGSYRFYAYPGISTLSVEADDCFELSTSPASFQVQLPLPNPDSVFVFGLKSQAAQPGMSAPITGSPTRCNFNVPFWMALKNEDCFPAAAVFSLKSNGLASFVSAEPPPDLVLGDSIVWYSGDSLLPGEIRPIRALLKMAGYDFLGDTLRLTGSAWALDATGALLQPPVLSHFASAINCAFDPNDKLVNLAEVPENYDPSSSELIYTIRFQNLGNDTAFNVQVLDTLAEELDWASFKPIAASHAGAVRLDEMSRGVEFRFDHILLPDSAANEAASHGFAAFSVRLKPGLPLGTAVTNQAAIYFDFNPPVLTNRVETRILSSVSGSVTQEQPPLIQAYPNPTSGTLVLKTQGAVPLEGTVQFLDLFGRTLHTETLQPGNTVHYFSMAAMPAGVYFVKVLDDGEPIWTEKIVKQ
ncbi:MAG: T9SS type A sorting domain-containing protein [Saprospiraceae bacterium]|nr:T9SS type A sorting domain-containing protein [Saprospiraceae bacterium]